MSFDNSRFTFDPWKDYYGVVMEQGRVQLDSDWNEWLAELARRIQAGTMDTLGRAVYPATTPYAFQISASSDNAGNHIAIGAGRMYVDGLLAENHGPWAAARWDPALGEMAGAPQIPGVAEVTVDYTQQPYLRGAVLPTGNGPFLAYLDVWRRPITYIEDPNLVDKAVGVDTSGRLQTVWQVKLLDVSSVKGVTCSTADSGISAWQKLIRPSAGQLTTGVVQSTPTGPCCLTSGTGYTGMENQFYRVEIHKPGTAKVPATFTWSRDDASVETAVTGIGPGTNTEGNPASQLTVQSMGRDQVLGFAPGNWIEITDDWQELNGQPGELHLIDSIDFAAKTITLDSPVSAASYPTTNGQTDPNRHTRIRRWDQAGKVYQSDGVTVWTDLGAAGSTGDIPVPPPGATLILENGVTVTFDLNPTNGSFNTGDFWTFAARTADGSVEILTNAYPRGIHHHYARLSIVTFPSTATDCRVEWPPASGGAGCCECTITVQPTDITANTTLQGILDRYRNLQTRTIICLMPGTYSLPSPLRFQTSHSNITLQASQEGSVIIQALAGQENQFADGMVVMDNVLNVGLRGMYFAVPMAAFTAPKGMFAGLSAQSFDPDVQMAIHNLVVSIGVRPVNCSGLTIENCEFGFADFEEDLTNPNGVPFGVGIFAAGQCSDWRIAGNTFAGVGNFLAGFMLAPSVVFNPPIVIEIARKPGPATAAAAKEVTASSPAKADKANLTLTNLAGNLQSIVNNVAEASLSANGGTVLPSLLDECVFEGNSFDGLTIAALVLGASETVQFTANRVDTCSAGFWFVSPLQDAAILEDPKNVTLIGLSIALGYPLPQGDSTPATQFVSVPAAPQRTRIYAGAGNYTDSEGGIWEPDVAASASRIVAITGGSLYQPPNPAPITGATPAATDQTIYQSERYGPRFSYTFQNLPQGYYQATLKFAEIWYIDPQTNKGVRIFDVSINGAPALFDFDIVANSGGANIADDQLFANIVPNAQGQIVIQFTGTSFGADPNAKISAVELDPQWGTSADGVSGFPFFYSQLAQLAQQGFAGGAPNSSMRLRVDRNEMQGLSSVAVLVLGDDTALTPNTGSLIMSGNRLANSFSFIFAEAHPSETSLLFYCTAAILLVDRCVVTGNMILNEGPLNTATRAVLHGANEASVSALAGKVFRATIGPSAKFIVVRVSFFLDDSAAPSPITLNNNTVPSVEIMVSANVFQGEALVLPDRYPSGSNVPSPMDSWGFLNTVVP